MAESTTTPTNAEKPVVVRVKRKAFQSALDAFWLEINERPSKRPLVDFGKLSLSDSSSSRAEELKTKKVLVQHVDTIVRSEDTFSVLQSFVPNSSNSSRSKDKAREGRHNIKSVDKQEQFLTKAKQKQEVLSRNARFEQIWRRRKGKQEASEDDAIYDMCQLYDVVRVDVEENEGKTQKDEELDDCRIMIEYLPLLEEVLPSAAREVEEDIHDYMSKQAADDYVYDFYAVKEDANTMMTDSKIPLIQVDDDDYYDGPNNDSEYETDDSNAENNPLNEYPDEEETSENEIEGEDEITSVSSSEEKSERDSSSGSHSERSGGGSHAFCDYEEDSGLCEWSDVEDGFLEDEEE